MTQQICFLDTKVMKATGAPMCLCVCVVYVCLFVCMCVVYKGIRFIVLCVHAKIDIYETYLLRINHRVVYLF